MKKNTDPNAFDEWLIECTGRSVYMNQGIVGLGPEPGDEPSEGYDGGMDGFGYFPTSPWTKAERRELADEMIRRWNAFGDAEPPEATL